METEVKLCHLNICTSGFQISVAAAIVQSPTALTHGNSELIDGSFKFPWQVPAHSSTSSKGDSACDAMQVAGSQQDAPCIHMEAHRASELPGDLGHCHLLGTVLSVIWKRCTVQPYGISIRHVMSASRNIKFSLDRD